jgi:hypothetical protein
LGNPPVWTPPTPSERPEAFHRMHRDCAKAITIVIAGERPPAMMHTLMAVSPALQTGIQAGLVGRHQCAWNDGVFDEGLDRLWLHMGQQMHPHVTTALHPPKDRRSFLRSCAPTTGTFPAATTAFSTVLFHHCRLTLMAGCDRGFVALHLVGQGHWGLFFTIPSRR